MTARKTGTVAARPAARPLISHRGARPLPATTRSTAMLLLNQELARARMREREADGASARLALTVLSARRRQRRARLVARRVRVSNSI